jgi:hypothetical protein
MARNKFASSVLSSSVGIAIGAVCVSWANIASALPPANILGTWNIIANQSPETLAITSQYGGGAGCNQILGTLVGSSSSQFPGSSTILGYYCPSTGRLAFSRYLVAPSTPIAFQIWVGNVSDVSTATPQGPNRMGGTFHILLGNPGVVLGEYPFQGQK